MTKQEKINEEYSKLNLESKVYPDSNGWATYDRAFSKDLVDSKTEVCTDIRENDSTRVKIRPISLQGIEDNNGWIAVESENDLAEESIYAFIRTIYPLFPETFVRIGRHKTNGKMIIWDFNNDNKYKVKQITHYREVKIEKPKPPLY